MSQRFPTLSGLLPTRACKLAGVLVFLSFWVLSSCGSSPEDSTESTPMEIFLEEAGEWSYVPEDSLCFLDLSAAERGDTLAVLLLLRGERVQGTLLHQLQDGTARYGKLNGERQGAHLTLVWQYISDGMADSTQLEWEINKDRLLPVGSADAGIYTRVDCDKTPRVDFDLGL